MSTSSSSDSSGVGRLRGMPPQKKNQFDEREPSQEEVGPISDANWTTGASEDISESSDESVVISVSSSDSESESDILQAAALTADGMSGWNLPTEMPFRPRRNNLPSCADVISCVVLSTYCATGTGLLVIGGLAANETVTRSKDPNFSSYTASNAAISAGILLTGTISVGCVTYFILQMIKDRLRWQ